MGLVLETLDLGAYAPQVTLELAKHFFHALGRRRKRKKEGHKGGGGQSCDCLLTDKMSSQFLIW